MKQPPRPIDSIRRLANFDSVAELAAKQLASAPAGGAVLESALSAAHSTRVNETLDVLRIGAAAPPEAFSLQANLEAIVLEKFRPAYLIVNDEIVIHGDFDREQLVRSNKPLLEDTAKAVGRVDLLYHPHLHYAGTGWLVASDIAVTNRHVAETFAARDRFDGFPFRMGTRDIMEARIDYLRQAPPTAQEKRRAEVIEVLYIAGPNEPDFAFLRVVTLADGIAPLTFYTGTPADEEPIAAIGYPARDLRNDPVIMDGLFGNLYEVKRFSPGQVMGREGDGVTLTGDYTSLGGSSGSAIVGLEDGKVRGLHFAGAFREANYFVAGDVVAAALARIKTQVAVPGPEVALAESAATRPAELANRDGYRAGFLGTGNNEVPLPDPGAWAADVAPVSDAADGVLRYRHFSVIQSASRRLPLITAVNIDGEQARRLKRKGEWRLDGRLQEDHQVGNDLYRANPLDRGHMVRRRDPGWGATQQEAEQGEVDTFHYTNAVPQHSDLNQKDWVGLEDYILEAAETRGFKVSIFTGPIFRDSDRTLKAAKGSARDVKIPEEFWKIAVIVDSESGILSATGYVLSHGPLVRGLLAPEFVFGQYKTYQVRIKRIESETGLDFGKLREHDPLKRDEEGPSAFRLLEGPQDIVLRG